MTVYDLTEEQIELLKATYFYQMLDEDEELLDGIDYFWDIPTSVIIEHYDGIEFVDDDF